MTISLNLKANTLRTCERLICRLKILPFKKLVIHRIGIQMFKYHKGMVPKIVCELFTLNSSNLFADDIQVYLLRDTRMPKSLKF